MTDDLVPLRVTYDAEADAAYIYLADEPRLGWRVKSIPLDPLEVRGMVNVDIDDDGRLVGIEVLDARSKLSDKLLTALTAR